MPNTAASDRGDARTDATPSPVLVGVVPDHGSFLGGTEVTLHLREGEDEFAEGNRLRNIIRKYSDHITLPIVMKEEEWDKDRLCEI